VKREKLNLKIGVPSGATELWGKDVCCQRVTWV